jgi:hypothetical protein
MHFDPDTGEDTSVDSADRERCVRACYDCLLAYGNQSQHGLINRHLVKDLLLKLANATVTGESQSRQGHQFSTERNVPAASDQPGSPVSAQRPGAGSANPEERFLAWLAANELRQPDGIGEEVCGVIADLIYRLRDNQVAVFFEDTDRDAHEVLRDEGMGVIIISPAAEAANWHAVVSRYPSVFGSLREGHL